MRLRSQVSPPAVRDDAQLSDSAGIRAWPGELFALRRLLPSKRFLSAERQLYRRSWRPLWLYDELERRFRVLGAKQDVSHGIGLLVERQEVLRESNAFVLGAAVFMDEVDEVIFIERPIAAARFEEVLEVFETNERLGSPGDREAAV